MLPTNVGKVLFAIASGSDLTKLEIKKRTALSMSTVLSSVDELVRRGLVTMGERRVERGGKPHAVINVHPDRRTYGISYKSGVLTAYAMGLRGEGKESLFREPQPTRSPSESVSDLVRDLSKKAPAPTAIGLALNGEYRDSIAQDISQHFGVPVILTTNTASVAYRALWQGGRLPLAVIGLGQSVKCAVWDREMRAFDLGDLPSSPAFASSDGCRALLSASKVEAALRDARFDDIFTVESGKVIPCRTQGAYARALALSIASLCRMVCRMLQPSELLLFGEYLSAGFFDRIKSLADLPGELRLLDLSREDFAQGAASCALIERVLS